MRGDRQLFRVSHRSAGYWSMFACWTSAMFSITKGQEASASAATLFQVLSITGNGDMEQLSARYQFFDGVALLASNATMILLMALMVGVFKPRLRPLSAFVCVVGAASIAMGMLEKAVIARFSTSNEMLLVAEAVKAMGEFDSYQLGSKLPSVTALSSLNGMAVIDLAFMGAAAIWAGVICLLLWRRSRRKPAVA